MHGLCCIEGKNGWNIKETEMEREAGESFPPAIYNTGLHTLMSME